MGYAGLVGYHFQWLPWYIVLAAMALFRSAAPHQISAPTNPVHARIVDVAVHLVALIRPIASSSIL